MSRKGCLQVNKRLWLTHCKKCGCQITNYGSGRPRNNCGKHKKFRVLLGLVEVERRRVAFIQNKMDRQYRLVNEIKLSVGECFYHEEYFGHELIVEEMSLRAFCWDHVDRMDKVDTISQMMGKYSDEELIAEIKKCVLSCANCHQIKTYENKDYMSVKNKIKIDKIETQLQLFSVEVT